MAQAPGVHLHRTITLTQTHFDSDQYDGCSNGMSVGVAKLDLIVSGVKLLLAAKVAVVISLHLRSCD